MYENTELKRRIAGLELRLARLERRRDLEAGMASYFMRVIGALLAPGTEGAKEERLVKPINRNFFSRGYNVAKRGTIRHAISIHRETSRREGRE